MRLGSTEGKQEAEGLNFKTDRNKHRVHQVEDSGVTDSVLTGDYVNNFI